MKRLKYQEEQNMLQMWLIKLNKLLLQLIVIISFIGILPLLCLSMYYLIKTNYITAIICATLGSIMIDINKKVQ